MEKYYIRQRLIFDCFGNCIRGAHHWENVRNSKGKTTFYDDIDDARATKMYLESLSHYYEYKIMTKNT